MTLLGSPLAVSANPIQTEHVQVALISEVEGLQPGQPFWVGLHFQIREGWHTYWQNPGDSGAAPTIDWTLPPGFEAGGLVFPYPSRLPAGPLMNFGYENEVTLLSQITPPANLAGSSAQLQAKADWLVCEIDCIPESASLSLDLPVVTTPPVKNEAALFAQAQQSIPRSSPWSASAQIGDEVLILQIDAPELQVGKLAQVSFFPTKDGVITNAAPQEMQLKNGALTLRIPRGYLSDLTQVNGVLVVEEALENQTIAQSFTLNAPVREPALQSASALPLWQIMLLALLGGATLNLMPCVFPVLSLKALSIVKKAQKSRQQVRRGAIAFTSGVLLSFLGVAGVLLLLRSLGQQVGWGFQLQSPVFVTLMAYLMFAVGLSLSGVFLFGASLMGIGQGLAARSGYVGEFFTGVFATVVATPCTAPFMATAIGVAITQPLPIAILIFELLGLGLALPYIAISFIPALQRRLPKPGAWMETFQQALAFPLYAATAWLVWVLTQQSGTQGLAVALMGLILIAFAAWLYQKTRLTPLRWQRIGTVLALVVLGFALTLAQVPQTLQNASQTQRSDSDLLAWQPYSADRLAELRQAGTPVFVNFSAAWCITCLVNEQVALNQPETAAAFESEGITLLKGDWTNQDQAITAILESFGRSGVPLYVLYPAGAEAKPIVLPQILSPGEIRTAIEQI
ncbi:MAG: thioredoxin family protein [Drouetiella hepatica Uher 2000/2452]|jgi:thiol:disulfide interchange protein DsbD|uniref:Thioredoxin family protein n=1 Tax=Drouetiella hepatica Uher 2000/2452 TaxID=904376 RepID=A0A951UL94_9CYAN|nr:thioredoxin family protein [Drouetiella hepatica Uher 2000/2452]